MRAQHSHFRDVAKKRYPEMIDHHKQECGQLQPRSIQIAGERRFAIRHKRSIVHISVCLPSNASIIA